MSRQFTSSLDVEASPEELLDKLTDFRTWSEWMPGLVDVQVLTSGPFGVGTRWRETRKMFGNEATEEFEVAAFEPPRRLDLHVDGSKGSTGKGSYTFEYRFHPQGGRTRVELNGTVDIPGFAFRVLGGLLIGTFRKACDRDMKALAAYVARSSE